MRSFISSASPVPEKVIWRSPLGVEAVRAGRSVYFSPLADIIDSLARAEREGRLRERIRFLCRSSLLIIDEIGYLSVGAGAGNLFFQLVNARYERGAMILTSNRGFAEWGKVFGDPVVATALARPAAAPRRGRPHRGRQLPAAPACRPGSRKPAPPQPPYATADTPRRRGRPPKIRPYPEPPFVRPAGGGRKRGTPFVPTSSSGHGAQERSRDETARGARLGARPLTAPSTVARILQFKSDHATEWGIFNRHFWGDFNRH